jgi:hypothetical protein
MLERPDSLASWGPPKVAGRNETRIFAPSRCVLTTGAFASGLVVAIGACAPIHPRVGQSGPPGPCVRAGSLWGHGIGNRVIMPVCVMHYWRMSCCVGNLCVSRPSEARAGTQGRQTVESRVFGPGSRLSLCSAGTRKDSAHRPGCRRRGSITHYYPCGD